MHGLGVEEVSSKCTLNGRGSLELAVEETRVLKSEEDNPGLGLLCSVGRVGGLDVGLGILDCRRTIFRRYRFPSEHPACTNDAVTVKSLFDLLVTQALSHSFIFEVGKDSTSFILALTKSCRSAGDSRDMVTSESRIFLTKKLTGFRSRCFR